MPSLAISRIALFDADRPDHGGFQLRVDTAIEVQPTALDRPDQYGRAEFVPYALTWIGIGMPLLRGRPVMDQAAAFDRARPT